MYVITDLNSDSAIGPFEMYEDAISFIAKVDEMSYLNESGLEVLDVSTPEDWLLENMDSILMANC